MQVAVQAALAPLLRRAAAAGHEHLLRHGRVEGPLTQKQKTQTVTGNLALADFSGRFGTNEVRRSGHGGGFRRRHDAPAGPNPEARGQADARRRMPPAVSICPAHAIPAPQDADLQAKAQVALAPLLQAVPQPDMNVTSGTVELKAHVTQKQKAQTVTGNLALADFTGTVREATSCAASAPRWTWMQA